MRFWPHIRAALVLLVILVGLGDGCPIPARRHTPEAWHGPRDAVAHVRRTFMRPFRPIGELFWLRQRWKLFPTAKLDQYLMSIEARRRGENQWTVLYRPLDRDADFMAGAIEYRRLRGAWNPGSERAHTGYGPFAEWIARRIFEAFPEYHRVRVRHQVIRLEPDKGRYELLDDYRFEKYEGRKGHVRSPR